MANATVYKIPEQNFGPLCERLEKLTRRARKLGKATPILTKIGETNEKVKQGDAEFIQTYFDVTIEAVPVCVDDFDFVASIDMSDDPEIGRVLRRVPGVLSDIDLPAKYRTTSDYCEHCGVNRRRNTVFILRHRVTGEWKQVGRQCLGPFLGGVNPEDVVRNMEMLISFDDLCSGAQGGDFFGFGGGLDTLDLMNTLVFTNFIIHENGWLSRSKARELSEQGVCKSATADLVITAFFNKERDKCELVKNLQFEYNRLHPDEKTKLENEVIVALDWIRSTDDKKNSDYLHNLHICCSKDTVNRRYLGIACSLLIAYKVTNNLLEAKPQRKPSEHVGTEGKQETFDLKVRDIKYWNSPYGVTNAIFFNDASGNDLLWKASRDPRLEIGSTYQIKAKVKKHGDFHGNKQTELSHAKILGAIGSF